MTCHSPVSVEDIWSKEVLAVSEAYACIRRALVLTDAMSIDALRVLMARTREAAGLYPDGDDLSAQAAMNRTLEHYSIYCAAVIGEREAAAVHNPG